MKFVVCDDDKIFLNGFRNELLKADSSLDVVCFDNSKQTLEYLKTEHNGTLVVNASDYCIVEI